MKNSYKAPTVTKAFQILRAISRHADGLKISDLSRELKISKSTVHGITAALEELGAIQRNEETKQYTPGLTLFELGRSAYARIDLKKMIHPVLVSLMEKIGETVFLGTINKDHITIIDFVEPSNDFKITAPIGSTIPLLAGAIGKVYLAGLPLEKATDILASHPLRRYTEHSITDPDIFFKKINLIRKNQVATDDEEYIPGVRAVAALIPNHAQAPSAIWTVGFKTSLDDLKMNLAVMEMDKAAQKIRQDIRDQFGSKDL